jgi:hypothetical protein
LEYLPLFTLSRINFEKWGVMETLSWRVLAGICQLIILFDTSSDESGAGAT